MVSLRKFLRKLQLGSLDTRFDVLDEESQLKYLHLFPKHKRHVRELLYDHKHGNIEIDDIIEYISSAHYEKKRRTY